MIDREEFPDLDLDQLDADLYRAMQELEKRNYGAAEAIITVAWGEVRKFLLSLPDPYDP